MAKFIKFDPFTRLYYSYWWFLYCVMQVLITGGMLLYIAFDVRKHFHQPIILITEFFITLCLAWEIIVRVIVKKKAVMKECSFLLDLFVLTFFIGLNIYMCFTGFTRDEDEIDYGLIAARYLFQIFR